MALQWLSLVATIWLLSINGTNSNFPAYSSHLKKILSISQLQLNNLASASDAGKLLGWLSGVAARHLPLPLVLLVGSSLGLLGYGLQYLFVAGHIHNLSYYHVFALTVLAGNSICWINTVCYILAIQNFPLDRHLAVGLSTSYVGLSAKIYTDLVDLIDGDNKSTRAQVFLLLNSIVPMIVCVLVSPFARDVSGSGESSRVLTGGFLMMFVITVFTGLFAVMTSLGSGRFMLPPLFVVVGLIVFLLLPLVIPLAEKIREMCQKCPLMGVYDDDVEGLGDNNNNGSNYISMEIESRDDEESGEEVGPMLMLRRVEFWLYFLAYLFGATLGLEYLNNLGQISESRGCLQTSSLVSLASAFGFFGRLLPLLIDYFFSKKKCSLSTSMAMGAMMAPMCGAFFILAISRHDVALYIATAVIGICTGAITSISVSTTTELFGAKNFGVNHNIVVLNIPIGSFLFGDFAAMVYNINGGHGQDSCLGHKCYQMTFLIWSIMCVSGTLMALSLHLKTKTRTVYTTQHS